MSIDRRVHLVEQLFAQLAQESVQFEQSSGLHCVTACGKCCSYSDIEASPLEFLPWAFHLFLEGAAEQTLAKLSQTNDLQCFNYKPLSLINQGRCNSYQHRGLICRLFGGAANTDKHGHLRLTSCRIIKSGQAEHFHSAEVAISQGLYVPVITTYYMQLNQIDFHLGNITLPINKALKMALEDVLSYYAYRPCHRLIAHVHPA